MEAVINTLQNEINWINNYLNNNDKISQTDRILKQHQIDNLKKAIKLIKLSEPTTGNKTNATNLNI